MAQSNKTEDDYESGNSKGVVDIAKYQTVEEKESTQSSAFEQVMSQMNIANRTSFDEQYSKSWNVASDEGDLLSILICEIDSFKDYNENYGHQGAAFMLLVIGLALKNTCEKYGSYLAHYNEGEFAILLKGGEVDDASALAESLRMAVINSKTEHKFSTVSDIVTLSIGISSVYPTSMKVLMQKSETALSNAQKAGCNQVRTLSDIKTEGTVLVTTDLDYRMSELELYNRTDFNNYFLPAWEESVRDQDLLSMIICELDFFDEFTERNESYISDDVILITAAAMQNQCEELNCFVAHLEGAKFAVLIKDANATKALKIAETLHSTIADLEMENEFSPVSDYLTMSLGLSSIFPNEDNSMKLLMKRVNAALNDARLSGHDQICVE